MACAECTEDIERERVTQGDRLPRIVERALLNPLMSKRINGLPDEDERELARQQVRDMLTPLYRVMINAIVQGPELLN
jgi:hypothetical protein